jgi:hypothetical protein
VQLTEVALDVEARVLFAGDQQRGARQVDLALVASDESPESPPRLCRV